MKKHCHRKSKGSDVRLNCVEKTRSLRKRRKLFLMGMLKCVENDEKERKEADSDNSASFLLFPGKNFL